MMIAPMLGIASQQARKWRTGTRPIPERHLDKLEAFFRERGARPPETPRLIDPRDISAPPVRHRIAVERRDPPMPPLGTGTIIEALKNALRLITLRAPAKPAAVAAAPIAERRDEIGPPIGLGERRWFPPSHGHGMAPQGHRRR
jgi:hypothetical protein